MGVLDLLVLESVEGVAATALEAAGNIVKSLVLDPGDPVEVGAFQIDIPVAVGIPLPVGSGFIELFRRCQSCSEAPGFGRAPVRPGQSERGQEGNSSQHD